MSPIVHSLYRCLLMALLLPLLAVQLPLSPAATAWAEDAVQAPVAQPDEQGEAVGEPEQKEGTFGAITSTLSSWGSKAMEQKRKLSIRYEIRGIRKEIEEDYCGLGSVFYGLYSNKTFNLLNDPEIQSILTAIAEKQARISELEAELKELGGAEEEDVPSAEETNETGSETTR